MRRISSRSIRITPLALAASLALIALPAATATGTFSGPGSFWDQASNGTGGIVPGAADDAALGAFDTELRTGFSIWSLAGNGRLAFSSGAKLALAAASSIGALSFNACTLSAKVSV
jgi:hypothetical protein